MNLNATTENVSYKQFEMHEDSGTESVKQCKFQKKNQKMNASLKIVTEKREA